MKNSLPNKSSFSYRNVLGAVCTLFFLASCEKDMKNSNTIPSPADAQQAASLAALDNAGIDTAGLVAWFNFNNGSLVDKSSYHNRIIYNNAQLTTDRNGVANNAYYFNGNSSYIEVKNSPSLSPDKEITLFTIVKFTDFYTGKCHGNRIVEKGLDGDPGYYDIGTSDGFYTNGMNCSQNVDKAHESFETNFCTTGAGDTTAFVQTEHWYHLIYTYGGGVAKFYVDGKLVDSHVVRLIPSANTEDVFIGTTTKANTQYPYWLNGSVDEVAIFNRALNANQVARLSAF